MPVPTWETHIPKALYQNIKYGKQLPKQSLQEYEEFNKELSQELLSIKSDNFAIHQVASAFCEKDCSLISTSGKPYYFDRAHLTLTGSEELRGVFETIIQ